MLNIKLNIVFNGVTNTKAQFLTRKSSMLSRPYVWYTHLYCLIAKSVFPFRNQAFVFHKIITFLSIRDFRLPNGTCRRRHLLPITKKESRFPSSAAAWLSERKRHFLHLLFSDPHLRGWYDVAFASLRVILKTQYIFPAKWKSNWANLFRRRSGVAFFVVLLRRGVNRVCQENWERFMSLGVCYKLRKMAKN